MCYLKAWAEQGRIQRDCSPLSFKKNDTKKKIHFRLNIVVL